MLGNGGLQNNVWNCYHRAHCNPAMVVLRLTNFQFLWSVFPWLQMCWGKQCTCILDCILILILTHTRPTALMLHGNHISLPFMGCSLKPNTWLWLLFLFLHTSNCKLNQSLVLASANLTLSFVISLKDFIQGLYLMAFHYAAPSPCITFSFHQLLEVRTWN